MALPLPGVPAHEHCQRGVQQRPGSSLWSDDMTSSSASAASGNDHGEADIAAAAALPAEAARDRSAAVEPAPEARAEVRRGDEEVAALRKKCKNSLYTACAVLSSPSLQSEARLCYTLLTPLWTSHSENAKDVRGKDEALAFLH